MTSVISALSSLPEKRSPVKCASTVSSLTTTSDTMKARIASRSGFGDTGSLAAMALLTAYAWSTGVWSACPIASSRFRIWRSIEL